MAMSWQNDESSETTYTTEELVELLEWWRDMKGHTAIAFFLATHVSPSLLTLF